MRSGIIKGDLNSSIYYLDSFGIKYFELSGENIASFEKFNSSSKFKLIKVVNTNEDSFYVIEYLDAKPIISLQNENDITILKNLPDKKVIWYEFEEDNILLFREQYSKNWKAFVDGKERKIEKDKNSMMSIPLFAGEKTIELKYKKTSSDWIGLAITLLGLFALYFLNKTFLIGEKH